MKKNILALYILSTLSYSVFAQEPSKNDFKVTADIQAGCDLSVQNINFGVLTMPLIDSTSQADLKVKCSKNINLDFAVFYSENANASNDVYTFVENNSSKYSQNGQILKNGSPIDSYTSTTALYCSQNPNNNYYGVFSNSKEFTSLIGMPYSTWVEDTYGLCSSDGKKVNLDTISSLGSNKGVLKGITSNESIAYYLSIPNQTDTIWSNFNKYTLLSTGTEQLIPMKANIKRADNPTYRMTPDTYQSTLTISLTY